MAYITLNRNNFFNNLDIITKKSKTKDKIAIVLKDNAYGHGIVEIATLAKEYGLTKSVVQNIDEATVVADFFEYVLVLADIPKHASEKIRYTINDLNAILSFPSGTKVELKVDTGMHRNGISMDALYTAFARIKEHNLILEAVFTHHRSADVLSSEWFWQNENFKKVKKHALELADEFGFLEPRFHSYNSAALFRCSDFDEDMARVGISAYGCMVLPKALSIDGFRPVLSLYASLISSRVLKQGEGVGYGATFQAREDTTIGNYDFGYGDGFLRACSNNYSTPEGAELIGRVSMDNSSFVTDKEQLLIFDDANYLSKSADTIVYEVLTSLKSSIKREII